MNNVKLSPTFISLTPAYGILNYFNLGFTVIILGLALVSGCKSNKQPAQTVSKPFDATVNQSLLRASDEVVSSLIDNCIQKRKLVAKEPNKLPVVGFHIVASPPDVDAELILKHMQVALLRTGAVECLSKIHPLSDGKGKGTNSINLAQPDYSFELSVKGTHTKSDNGESALYIIQCSLSNPQGIAIWLEEKTIALQSKKPVASF